MAAGALSIKLRCASWQQLATIYRRDLSKGTMFLKASTPPAIGTTVRIDLALPSETVIVLSGTVEKHVTDPTRGSGVELKLGAIPETTVWMIESALAAEQKVRAQQPAPPAPPPGAKPAPIEKSSRNTGPIQSLSDGEDLANAEQELRDALTSEVESLKKLNPFLVLGVGYEASDADVRSAFGELTKRYHPDRFARYQSNDLRQIAAEIFILIRDAYRRIGDDTGRAQVLQSLGRAPAPRAVALPPRAPTAPIAPPPLPKAAIKIEPRPPADKEITAPLPPEARAPLPLQPPSRPTPQTIARPQDQAKPLPGIQTERKPILSAAPPVLTDGVDMAALEDLLDTGRLDEALSAFKVLAKKHTTDRVYRAGIELVEGMKALGQRDRLEAAQRFEAALEIDPSNERAARELAEMRRQATNERKGLLSRLMNKKE